MGEKQNQPFQLSFNPSLKVDFQGSRVTSDRVSQRWTASGASSAVLVRDLVEEGRNGVQIIAS